MPGVREQSTKMEKRGAGQKRGNSPILQMSGYEFDEKTKQSKTNQAKAQLKVNPGYHDQI